ncbi:MAG: adenosine deaminase [Candidatus Eremiobacteraeota bacterium]|nr:adenosine deaminase [Candidatus Eremiobacteraeota bacterium]
MTTGELLRRLPKVQLHCHLEGTLQGPTFLELAQRYGVSTAYRPRGSDESAIATPKSVDDVYAFADFGEFLFTFAAACRSLQVPADYERLLREYSIDAQTHNVGYAELFISPSVWRFFNPQLDLAETVRVLSRAAEVRAREGGPVIRFIVDLTRNFGPGPAMETARLAVDCMDFGCVGIGLGGDEANFPPELFADAFAYARGQGLHSVVHAGEAAGAQSVRAALDVLHAERIGHGIRALEDPKLIALIVERGIPLEVCPTSNLRTGVVASEAAHPLAELDRAGVKIVLDSDDPAMFRTDITAEYEVAERLVGLDAVLRFARNSIECSFAPEARRASLTAQFERACAELLPARRS